MTAPKMNDAGWRNFETTEHEKVEFGSSVQDRDQQRGEADI